MKVKPALPFCREKAPKDGLTSQGSAAQPGLRAHKIVAEGTSITVKHHDLPNVSQTCYSGDMKQPYYTLGLIQ